MKPILLDTGVIVALLDRSESEHQRCCDAVSGLRAALVTCEAVIAESCYLLRIIDGAVDAVLANVEKGTFLVAFDLSGSISRVRELMHGYRDTPMDFADACLVHLASELSTGAILTLDSDFLVYRWGGNQPFKSILY